MNLRRLLFGGERHGVRHDLRQARTGDIKRRRAVIGVSLAGMAAMAPVSMLQTGIVEHLADPPVRGFDSDKVNLSDAAYRFGVPDGPIALASFAANIPLAALGPANRAQTQPWVPVAAAAKAAIEAVVASWYFYQMPAREKAWCAYCITGALASIAVFALTVPEAAKGWRCLTMSRGARL